MTSHQQPMINVCIVTPFFPSAADSSSVSGIGKLRLVNELKCAGVSSVVITPQKTGQPASEDIQGTPVYRVPSYLIPGIRYPIPHFISLHKHINRICTEYGIDLIDFHHQEYLTTVPAMYLRSKPKVVTVNGFPGVSWTYGKKSVDWVGFLQTQTIGRQVLKRADGLRLLAGPLRKDLSSLRIKQRGTEIIYQGVDTDTFQPARASPRLLAEFGIRQDETVVMYIGRFDRVKGVEYLIEAADDLTARYEKLRFIFVGPQDLESSTRRQRSTSKQLVFTGYRADIPDLLSIADIFALPSLAEAGASAAMEAGACGIPVIGSKVGGVPEVVLDWVTGILVRPANVADLTTAIIQLVDNSELRNSFGRNAREHVQANFSWKVIRSRLRDFYTSTIKTWESSKAS